MPQFDLGEDYELADEIRIKVLEKGLNPVAIHCGDAVFNLKEVLTTSVAPNEEGFMELSIGQAASKRFVEIQFANPAAIIFINLKLIVVE